MVGSWRNTNVHPLAATARRRWQETEEETKGRGDTPWVLKVTPGGGVLSEVPSGPSLHTCAPCAVPPLIPPQSHRFYQIIWTD